MEEQAIISTIISTVIFIMTRACRGSPLPRDGAVGSPAGKATGATAAALLLILLLTPTRSSQTIPYGRALPPHMGEPCHPTSSQRTHPPGPSTSSNIPAGSSAWGMGVGQGDTKSASCTLFSPPRAIRQRCRTNSLC